MELMKFEIYINLKFESRNDQSLCFRWVLQNYFDYTNKIAFFRIISQNFDAAGISTERKRSRITERRTGYQRAVIRRDNSPSRNSSVVRGTHCGRRVFFRHAVISVMFVISHAVKTIPLEAQ